MSDDALSRILDRLMTEAHLSSSELGRRLRIPATTIKGIRNGDSINPTIATLLPIAKYFEISVSELIDDHMHIQQKSNYFSKIPVVTWEESVLWPATRLSKHHELCIIDRSLSKESFALHIDTEDYVNIFKKDEYIFIDHPAKPMHGDYILINKSGQTHPTIKKLILDDGNSYIQSITAGLNTTTELTEEYKIIGVVLGYKRWFKI